MNTNVCVEQAVVHESYFNSAGMQMVEKWKHNNFLTSGDVSEHTPGSHCGGSSNAMKTSSRSSQSFSMLSLPCAAASATGGDTAQN